jgi:multisubunit Na+/H+ antiporter MnhC subunit
VDASAYALTHGLRRTRGTLEAWRRRPWPVLRAWLGGSLAVAVGLLLATWVVSLVAAPGTAGLNLAPPLVVGGPHDVVRILSHNLLVLAFHAMACVAGFIAGSSLPLQAPAHTGLKRWVHERGRPVALAFVVGATIFSLSTQALVLGMSAARVAFSLHAQTAVLLVGLLPHAVPELAALFLPLAAWMVASRRDQWEQLLAATLVTTTLAVPVLVLASLWEVYGAPHLLQALLGYR